MTGPLYSEPLYLEDHRHRWDTKTEGILYGDDGEPQAITAICETCRVRVVVRDANEPRTRAAIDLATNYAMTLDEAVAAVLRAAPREGAVESLDARASIPFSGKRTRPQFGARFLRWLTKSRAS